MDRRQAERIPLVTDRDQLSEDQQHQFASIEESRGGVRGPFAALLNSPPVAGRVGTLGEYIRYESHLTAIERELAILTTARELDCAFEWAAHEPIASEVGVSDATIETIATGATVGGLTETQANIVQFGRELFRENAVSDETFATVSEHHDDMEMTELAATFGYYSMLACVLNAFEVPPGPDAPELP